MQLQLYTHIQPISMNLLQCHYANKSSKLRHKFDQLFSFYSHSLHITFCSWTQSRLFLPLFWKETFICTCSRQLSLLQYILSHSATPSKKFLGGFSEMNREEAHLISELKSQVNTALWAERHQGHWLCLASLLQMFRSDKNVSVDTKEPPEGSERESTSCIYVFFRQQHVTLQFSNYMSCKRATVIPTLPLSHKQSE